MRASLLFMLLLIACGGSVDEPDRSAPASATDPRFVGHWLLQEEVARGGWSAVVYELRADGAIVRGNGVEYSGDIDALGSVEKASTSRRCSFGARWRSQGSTALVVDGRCSDDIDRAIAIRFVNAPPQNSVGATIEIESVGGEAGWTRAKPWGWKMEKCASIDACERKLR